LSTTIWFDSESKCTVTGYLENKAKSTYFIKRKPDGNKKWRYQNNDKSWTEKAPLEMEEPEKEKWQYYETKKKNSKNEKWVNAKENDIKQAIQWQFKEAFTGKWKTADIKVQLNMGKEGSISRTVWKISREDPFLAGLKIFCQKIQ
jgi:hypothetical protein